MTTLSATKGKFGLATFLALIIALLGIVTPIIWDHYKTRTNLELQHLASTTLVEDSPSLSKLQIFYDGKPIKAISKITFSLVNVGRKPIIKADIISPPTISFPEGVTLLDFQVDRLVPPNLKIHHDLDPSNRTLCLNFPLLNPEDLVQFSVLLGGPIPKYQAGARIANLKELIVVDRAGELQKKRSGIPWTVYPVGFFTLIFAAVSVSLIGDAKKERKNRRIYIAEKTPLPRFDTKKDYVELVKDILSYTTDKKKGPIINTINQAIEEPLSEKDQANIENAILNFLKKGDGNLGGAIISLCIMALGLWYVLTKVL